MTHPALRRIQAANQVTDYYVAVAQADAIAEDDVSAVILWLRYATCSPRSRRQLAVDIMRRSMLIQANLLQIVDCHGCGWPLSDGCELCTRRGPDRWQG